MFVSKIVILQRRSRIAWSRVGFIATLYLKRKIDSLQLTRSLKDPQLVLSRLRIVDFEQVEILNFDLLCYLLKTKTVNQKYLFAFLEQSSEDV